MTIPKPLAKFILWVFSLTEEKPMTIEEWIQLERTWEEVNEIHKTQNDNRVTIDPMKVLHLIRVAREGMERIEMLIRERDGAMNMARAAQRERDVLRSTLADLQEHDRS